MTLPLLLLMAIGAPSPIDPYLMERNAEIALARSAAPDSLSRDATVLVLGAHGYETAVKGTNGFVCLVERSWMQPFDAPEFMKTDGRMPMCLNPPGARTHLPFTFKTTELVIAGVPKQEMFNQLKAAFDRKELPLPEPGSMCYMLSKQQNFGPQFGHADPHLMFWYPRTQHITWGAEFGGSPIDVKEDSPDPVTTFIISVSNWSDGSKYTDGDH
jgi:hypothetical protein